MKCYLSFLAIAITAQFCTAQQTAPPEKLYGELFKEIQLNKIFADSKTFVDCTPKRKVMNIMYDYGLAKGPAFDLKKFVNDNFESPAPPPVFEGNAKEKNTTLHIKKLWSVLKREADKKVDGSSLLPLPNAYIVPGGRFREIYYWDSYFTMLGLKESGETDMIENMIKNFAFLIDTYGHIPNGNRSYYLSRSQPPFFSMMVDLLAGIKGNTIYKTYLPQLVKEYNYWMDKTAATKHKVVMPDGSILNRYYDRDDFPRQESYAEDFEVSEKAAQQLAMQVRMNSPEALQKLLDEKKQQVNRNLRSGAESGWDFSSRWFQDEKNIATIQTTDIVPVDLNCLMYNLEKVISKSYGVLKNSIESNKYKKIADKRKAAILKYFWNDKATFYCDYNLITKTPNNNITAAGYFPLFVKIAQMPQAYGVNKTGKTFLLKPGGIVTTTNATGQQWDAPNGWAPLQWVAVMGLANYGFKNDAKEIAKRWIAINDKVYAATGKMMEKYNVEDLNKEAGGGEYPSQDGFGWSNGVYLAMMAYQKK